jgi:hypothetical protein
MKTPSLSQLSIAAIGLLMATQTRVQGDFIPVPLTPGSYTFGIVVPSNTVQAVPYCINSFTGSGLSLSDNTFYEQGMAARPGQPGANSGIPPHNTIFTNIRDSSMTFLMPADYTTNDDLMVYSDITSGTFTFTTPTVATSLAILCMDGNGGMTVDYTVTHSDSTTESGTINLLDWFSGGGTVAWGANGRMDQNGDFNNYNSSTNNNNVPYLYANKIAISGAASITSITFNYSSGGAVANFFAVSGSTDGINYTPIPVTGFNEMSLIPAAIPFPVTATMDNGTNIDNPGNTWFEQGYYQANAGYGLPPSGQVFASQSQPTHGYLMGNYSSNNAVLIDANHLSSTITPAVPAPAYAIAFLTAGGNIGGGTMNNIAILEHLDGVNETNTFYGYDWFNQSQPGAVAWNANGRVNLNNRTLNNLGNTTPNLFETYFPLNDTTSPVTNIVVQYGTAPGGNSTTFILAVSASSVPVAPVITQEPLPATQTWYPSQTATISVQVSGTPTITNYWFVESNGVYVQLTDGVDANGSVVSGSSTTTLTISDLTLADGTNYEYGATNAAGGELSTPAIVVINTGTPVAPIIDSQIPDVSITTLTVFTNITTKTNTFSVTIDPTSAPPFTYQWYSGLPQGPGNAIANATNATFTSVDLANVSISCIVSNFVGTATSSPVALVAGTPTAYQAALLAYNPVAYWPLTELGGTTAFDYAGNNNGTYHGTYTLGQPGLAPTGGIGANTSVALDGSTAYVDIPVNNLNIVGPITVIQWVQTTVEHGFTTSLGHTDSGYRLDVDQGGDPHFADDGPDATSTTAITDGNWHQLVGVYDGTYQYLYVDGILKAGPSKSTPAGSGDDVWIGGAPDYNGRFYLGNTAQCAILTNGLTAAQVAALYYSLELPPTVSITPATPTMYVDASLTLTAALNGTPPLGLQWYYIDTSNNSNNIPGATNATYEIVEAPLTNNGATYGINVTNAFGSANASVVLSVQNGPPVLLTDLSVLNAEGYAGAPVTYSVGAAGTLPIFYQWYVNGVAVAGATGSSFTDALGCGTNEIYAAITNAFSDGTPTVSSTASVYGDTTPTNITFTPNTAWMLNGSLTGFASPPGLTNDSLELTDGGGGEASSAFYYTAQYVGSFTASFDYTAGGGAGADGVAFILQDSPDTTNALGAPGGDLGYFQIEPSIALEIDLYNFVGIAPSTNGLTDGSIPQGLDYGPTGNVFVNSGNPINFQLNLYARPSSEKQARGPERRRRRRRAQRPQSR